MIFRFENVAMPFAGLAVAVPARVPLPGFVPMAIMIGVVAPATMLPLASSIATRTAGAMELPTMVVEGCVTNANCVAAVRTLNGALVAPVKPAELAVSV